MIKTERLLLRPAEAGDCRDIFEYAKHPEVGPRAGWKPHESEEETARVMRDVFLGKEHVFVIVHGETGRVIGSIGLADDPARDFPVCKMLGYALSRAYWGVGLMTEAVRAMLHYGFREAHLSLISAYCYPQNAASRRVLEKCGFLYEGTLRMAGKSYTGELRDGCCFSMKAEEYLGGR